MYQKYLIKRISLLIPLVFLLTFTSIISCSKENIQTKNISRIISLSPAATEIIFALDAQDLLIARTDFCDYPEDVSSIASVGGFDGKAISLEKIIALKPDFVCLTQGMHNYLESSLASLGISYVVLDSTSFSDIYDSIITIGNAINKKDNAEIIIAQIKNQIDSISSKVADQKGLYSVYFEVAEKPYISCGGTSFIDGIISAAGAKNIFENIKDSYPIISEESIIALNPSAIVIPIYSELQDVDTIRSQILNRIGWNEITAIKENRIIFVDGNITERPGPRIGLAVQKLNNELYGK